MTSSPLFLKLFAADGLLNLAWNDDEGQSNYEVAQRFAGGALSVYAGTGKLVKGKKFLSKYELKNTRTFLKYGAQSSVYDFAYTEKKYFVGEDGQGGREWYEHVGMFAIGGLAGLGSGQFFSNTQSSLRPHVRIGIGAGIHITEGLIMARFKNGLKPGGLYSGRSQQAKYRVLGAKWYWESMGILRGN